jgi:hypothetical protein
MEGKETKFSKFGGAWTQMVGKSMAFSEDTL